jgi:hypothetical protein
MQFPIIIYHKNMNISTWKNPNPEAERRRRQEAFCIDKPNQNQTRKGALHMNQQTQTAPKVFTTINAAELMEGVRAVTVCH